jgi:cytochrome b
MSNSEIVWNLQTRIIHWLIAIPVLFNFFIEGGDRPHKILGYIALAALVLRIIWGFKSASHYAHFRHFPLKANDVLAYGLSLTKAEQNPYKAHNPVASWIYIFIWILVLLLGITGFMMGLDAYWGEEWLEELHESLSSGMKVLVLLHFVGIIMDSIKYKRKTWLGMITGKKI